MFRPAIKGASPFWPEPGRPEPLAASPVWPATDSEAASGPALPKSAISPLPVLATQATRCLDVLILATLAVLLSLLLSSCATTPMSDQVFGTGYTPTNIYRAEQTLSPRIKRVAALPLVAASGTPEEAFESLEPVLQSELSRLPIAEWVFITSDDLRRLTDRRRWSADEPLPPDFLKSLRAKLACDAVLFTQLTHYRPLRPVALGWRFKLVDGEDGRVLWAADETFDSGVVAVANAARRYYQRDIRTPSASTDSRMVLESPRYFAEYTLHALFDTAPGR